MKARFAPGDKVIITELEDRIGSVLDVIVCRGGVAYLVEYWNQGTVHCARLWEDEVSELPNEGRRAGLFLSVGEK